MSPCQLLLLLSTGWGSDASMPKSQLYTDALASAQVTGATSEVETAPFDARKHALHSAASMHFTVAHYKGTAVKQLQTTTTRCWPRTQNHTGATGAHTYLSHTRRARASEVNASLTGTFSAPHCVPPIVL